VALASNAFIIRYCCMNYNYNRGNNGREKQKRKIENDVTGLDDERGLQQVEGESWTSWLMTSLDVRACLGRQRTKKKKIVVCDILSCFYTLVRCLCCFREH